MITKPITSYKSKTAAKPKLEDIRLSHTMSLNITPALAAQINAFAQTNGFSRSKLFNRALLAYCGKPKEFKKPRWIGDDYPQPQRTKTVSWYFPHDTERAQLEAFAKRNKVNVSTLVRQIMYEFTKTEDKNITAAADAWD